MSQTFPLRIGSELIFCVSLKTDSCLSIKQTTHPLRVYWKLKIRAQAMDFTLISIIDSFRSFPKIDVLEFPES